MRLKPDGKLRRQLFASEAMAHPAKGHIGLWWEIIERHTLQGQTILDPMAGIGTTMLAALLGRNVVCVEMESHFVAPMRASWEKMRQHGPMMGHTLGQVAIIQGDARCLPLGQQVEAVVTSPPYSGEGLGNGEGPAAGGSEGRYGRWAKGTHTLNASYTRPVDAVVTSPPFGEAQTGGGIAKVGYIGDPGMAQRVYSAKAMASDTADNIGNLRGKKYWEAMRQVYAGCHQVLRSGGVMVLVVKGFTREGQYVDLPQQTVDCCQELGFKVRERWERELWSLSFWRILQQRKDPSAFDNRLRFESVLVLTRG